jgi:hypothetical protein
LVTRSVARQPAQSLLPGDGLLWRGSSRSGEENGRTLYQYRSANQSWFNATGFYVGGAIVPDRLFFRVDGDMTRTEGAQVTT